MKKFDEIYSELSKTDLSDLNKTLKTKKNTTVIIIFLLLLFFILIFLGVNETLTTIIMIVFFVIASFVSFANDIKAKNKAINYYYNNLFLKILNTIFPRSEYEYSKGLNQKIYAKCNHLSEFDNYSSQHYIKTQLDDNILELSKITTYKVETTNEETNNHRHSLTFDGAIAHINCSLELKNSIRIVRNSDIFNNKGANETIVKLDSDEFEKNFDVICDDKTTAYEFLTSDIIGILNNLKNEVKIPFEILFDKSSGIYFKFFINGFLDIGELKGTLDRETMLKHYNELMAIYKITSAINNYTKLLDN